MRFDTKIAIVIRDDLAAWQKMNVTAFLVSGIAGTVPETVGEPYVDGSGNRYLPMFQGSLCDITPSSVGLPGQGEAEASDECVDGHVADVKAPRLVVGASGTRDDRPATLMRCTPSSLSYEPSTSAARP